MKRTASIVLAASIALSMTACDALDAILNVNLFSAMAAVDENDIADADAGTLVELSASPSFYDALSGSPSTKASALATIDAALPGAAPADKQELLALAANIELQTTPAGDLINNIGSLMSDLIEGTEPDEAEIEGLIRGILPASVLGSGGVIDEAAFLSMIAGLEAANARYDDLGTAIGTGGYADGADVVAGDIAQSALVAAMIASVEIPAAYVASSNIGDYLFDLLTDGLTPDPTAYTFPDTASGPLGNILSAAGIAF